MLPASTAHRSGSIPTTQNFAPAWLHHFDFLHHVRWRVSGASLAVVLPLARGMALRGSLEEADTRLWHPDFALHGSGGVREAFLCTCKRAMVRYM